ncbi:hypothetical protein BGZ65_010132, partial [Modicella reniformis]
KLSESKTEKKSSKSKLKSSLVEELEEDIERREKRDHDKILVDDCVPCLFIKYRKACLSWFKKTKKQNQASALALYGVFYPDTVSVEFAKLFRCVSVPRIEGVFRIIVEATLGQPELKKAIADAGKLMVDCPNLKEGLQEL